MTKASSICYEIEEGFGFDESRRVYVGGHYPLDVIGGDDVAWLVYGASEGHGLRFAIKFSILPLHCTATSLYGRGSTN
jgi:hypothetical protein